ncbi:chromodomain helicase DNA binding protein 7 [Echinococcus multilocularis]|uniref:Chromodomain helicase DNA binding protein 7 n=1 Tax=Echinococcus multilocularis TaxID=6211 RepID=A0A068YH61_ECHMU|nr:chromodomain helicase DNA binding protein 7 [Echinococcus multilocularis]
MWTLRSQTLVGEETGGANDTSYGIEESPDGCRREGGGVNKARESEADKRRSGSKAKRNLMKQENGRMEKEVKEEEVHEVNCEDGNVTKCRGRSHARWRRLMARVAAFGASLRRHRHQHRHWMNGPPDTEWRECWSPTSRHASLQFKTAGAHGSRVASE